MQLSCIPGSPGLNPCRGALYTSMTHTYLSLVEQVDGAGAPKGVYRLLSHDDVFLGKVLPFVAEQLVGKEGFRVNPNDLTVKILATSESERSQIFEKLCSHWRQEKRFTVLEGWRNELYPVYNPSKSLYFVIERSAACLFGLVTYGSHITGYIPAKNALNFKIWVPRRSFTKPTWPGKLDNTVAGGLGFPNGPWETSVKECQEEAGLPAEYVEQNLKTTGVVTYEFQLEQTLDTEAGVFQPEVEYTYDLVMDERVQPHPEDGEVHEFNLMPVSEVQERLFNGEFKYNCALVMIDFFIRHGIITPETEPDYLQIVGHCHRVLEYPLR